MEQKNTDPYIHGENTPISNFLEELLSRLDVDLSDIGEYMRFVNKTGESSYDNRPPLDKENLLSSLIQDMRQLASSYKISKNGKVWDQVYKNVYDPILKLNKNDKLVKIEKVLHDVANFVKKIFRNDFENGLNSDQELEMYNKFFWTFLETPISDFSILYKIITGENKKEEYQHIIKKYKEKNVLQNVERSLKKDFDELWEDDFKTKWAHDAKIVDAEHNKDIMKKGYDALFEIYKEIPIQYYSQLHAIMTGELKREYFKKEKEKYIDDIYKKIAYKHFNELWNADFKHKWAHKVFKKDIDQSRQSDAIQSLEEKIRLQIREEFLKG